MKDWDNRIGIPDEIKLRHGFRNGEVAIKYNELDHDKIELFLRNEFPKDTATFSGVCKYYICNYSKTTWQGVDRIHDRMKAITITELCDGLV
jgi:hypothetical protein